MEADFVTGAAKNQLELALRSRHDTDELGGIDHSFVAYRRGQQVESAFIQTVREAGIPIDVIQERGRFDTSVPDKLRHIAEDRDADIVETHNAKSHFFLRWSGIWRSRAWLAFHHGYTAEDLKMRLYHATTRWSLRRARQVVTVCRPFAEQLARQGVPRDRIQIQHNAVKPFSPVEAETLAAIRSGLALPEGTRLLVCLGRLSKEKGHTDLLEALALLLRLLPNGPKAHLAIVGEGMERSRIEAACRRLGLEVQVTLAGLQRDVRPYYALADVVVLPSHSEGSPNVLLEAMSAGCAVVATNVGGIPEIVADNESALLVPPRDPHAMAQALGRMLADAALRERLATRARQRAAAAHSPEGYRRSMLGLYEELTAGAPAGVAH
jgi:glycosyltransferase involved in cell wall biosynthesis